MMTLPVSALDISGPARKHSLRNVHSSAAARARQEVSFITKLDSGACLAGIPSAEAESRWESSWQLCKVSLHHLPRFE